MEHPNKYAILFFYNFVQKGLKQALTRPKEAQKDLERPKYGIKIKRGIKYA